VALMGTEGVTLEFTPTRSTRSRTSPWR
jgi:hypothetical protein